MRKSSSTAGRSDADAIEEKKRLLKTNHSSCSINSYAFKDQSKNLVCTCVLWWRGIIKINHHLAHHHFANAPSRETEKRLEPSSVCSHPFLTKRREKKTST
jgi:hypothetical protein